MNADVLGVAGEVSKVLNHQFGDGLCSIQIDVSRSSSNEPLTVEYQVYHHGAGLSERHASLGDAVGELLGRSANKEDLLSKADALEARAASLRKAAEGIA